MDGREEKTKVKLFLYTIGNQGREIYDTLPFSRGPTERLKPTLQPQEKRNIRAL